MKKQHVVTVALVGLATAAGGFLVGRAKADGIPATNALTYAGTLEDVNGAPLAGPVNLQIQLWDDPVEGEQKCFATSPNHELVGGRFSIQLPDTCTQAVGANPNLWVDVLVDGGSLGRAKLGAVPYAVEAQRATAAAGPLALQVVPQGAIVMWSGSLATVPAGWALCDGKNGTPDLTDRFILGVAASENPGAKGGAHSAALTLAQLPAHTHTGTTGDQSQSHTHAGTTAGSHAWPDCNVHDDGSGFTADLPDLYRNDAYIGGNCGFKDKTFHSHAFTTGNASQGHTHAFTTDATGSGAAVDKRPAFYKLAFIIKL